MTKRNKKIKETNNLLSFPNKIVFFCLLLIFISMTFLCILNVLILFPFVFLFDKNRNFLHRISVTWALVFKCLNPWWKFSIEGQENLKNLKETPIFISNHQSNADILALLMLNTQFRWIAKASLFKIPFFGWSLKAVGHIPVQRGNKLSSEKCLADAAIKLKKKVPVIFFPEGTRSHDGNLKPFKTGAFRLAQELNLPIVPITIYGTAKLLPKGSFLPEVTEVHVKIHDPIYPKNLTLHTLTKNAQDTIEQQLFEYQRLSTYS